jgi:hypothetical protein
MFPFRFRDFSPASFDQSFSSAEHDLAVRSEAVQRFCSGDSRKYQPGVYSLSYRRSGEPNTVSSGPCRHTAGNRRS